MDLIDSWYDSLDGGWARRKTATYTGTQKECGQISMPWVEFEPTIRIFERAKTFRALDSTATVIGDLEVNNL
jgi:hypothetical protein